MEPPFDVTLVTYDAAPDLSRDDQILRAALERAGLRVRPAVWTDPTVDWRASRLTVIRATLGLLPPRGDVQALDRNRRRPDKAR